MYRRWIRALNPTLDTPVYAVYSWSSAMTRVESTSSGRPSLIFSTPPTRTQSQKPEATAFTPSWKATPPLAEAAPTLRAETPLFPMASAIIAPRWSCPWRVAPPMFATYKASMSSTPASPRAFRAASANRSLRPWAQCSLTLVRPTPATATRLI